MATLASSVPPTGGRLLVNAAPYRELPAAVLAAADPVVVNEHEASALADGVVNVGIEPVARALARRCGSVVVTLGAEGAIAVQGDEIRRWLSVAGRSVCAMRWSEFAEECPEFAVKVRKRFEKDQLFLIGTIRSDGSPRISGVECDFVGDDLMTSMIWQSAKAVDLLRDDRVTVHSLVGDKEHESEAQGDLKLYGRALAVDDQAQKRRYEAAIHARIDWHPDEPYHCFAFEIERAGFVRFVDQDREVWSWRTGEPLTKRTISAFGPE